MSGDPRLILILSSERSGSTLTRVVLGAHDRIVSPQEMFLMRYPTFRAYREHKPVAIESLVEYFDLLGQPTSRAEIDRTCRDLDTHAVYRWLASFLPPAWHLLDKTPAYANDGETLRRSATLEPFYIWLIRHPLGVIESHVRLKLEKRHTSDLSGLARRARDGLSWVTAAADGNLTPMARQREAKWVAQQTVIREFLANTAAPRQCRVYFEDLVREPEATVGALCAALGVDVQPAMLAACRGRRKMNVHLGDPNFHKHDRIEAVTADQWRRHYAEDVLTLETRRLMDALDVRGRG
jgi:LPS sulfotransferase NodH